MRRRAFLTLPIGAGATAALSACMVDPNGPNSGATPTEFPEDREAPTIEVPAGDPPAELQTEDLIEGGGAEAVAGKLIAAHYVGVAWSTGEVFDSSWDRGEPLEFPLGAGMVIEGWDKGLEGMKVGGRRKITIPPEQAYGDQGAGGVIGPGETLIFVCDLVEVK